MSYECSPAAIPAPPLKDGENIKESHVHLERHKSRRNIFICVAIIFGMIMFSGSVLYINTYFGSSPYSALQTASDKQKTVKKVPELQPVQPIKASIHSNFSHELRHVAPRFT